MPNISPPNISCMGSMLQYTGKHATVCTTGGPKPYRTLESPCSKDHQLVPPHYHMIDYLMVIANTSKFPQRTLQILLVYPRYIHHSEPRIQSGSTSPRTCTDGVRLTESCPHAWSRSTHTIRTTRHKRDYKRTRQATDGRRKMRRHVECAWQTCVGTCDMNMRANRRLPSRCHAPRRCLQIRNTRQHLCIICFSAYTVLDTWYRYRFGIGRVVPRHYLQRATSRSPQAMEDPVDCDTGNPMADTQVRQVFLVAGGGERKERPSARPTEYVRSSSMF